MRPRFAVWILLPCLCLQLPDAASAGLTAPAMRRAYETVQLMRSFYPELVREDTDPLQLFIGQLRYSVHTLSFDEAGPLQKEWALYASSRYAERIGQVLGAG